MPRPKGELSPWQEARKTLGTALANDWRMVPLLFFYVARSFLRFLGRRWELVVLVLCGFGVVVLFLDPFGETPWETAVPGAVPGFVSGGYYVAEESKPVEYVFYTPPQFQTQEGPYPLIVALHNSAHAKLMLQDGLASAIRARLQKGGAFDFAVFFVHSKGHLERRKYMAATMEVLEHVIQRHRIDRKRVYLIGHSRAGCAVWDLASDYPERWAALVPICPLSMPYSTSKIPCWVFQGESDKLVSARDIRALVQTLRDRGGETLHTEYPKAGHDISQQVYADDNLFAWFAKKSRP